MHTHPADTSGFEDEHLNCYLTRVLQTVDRTIAPHLDLDLHHNTTYEQAQLLDLLTHISLEEEFANSGAKTRRIRAGQSTHLRADRRSPVAKALGYHLRALDPPQVHAQFDAVLGEIRSLATRARLFTGRVDLAIDEHEWLFYGDDDTEMVTNTNPAQGTDLAFTFLTACVVSPDFRLTVGVVPLGPDTELGQALVQLLGPITTWLDIRRVFLDRGFYRVRVIQALEAFDLEYVVRAVDFPTLAEGPVETTVEEDYVMGGGRPPYEMVTLTRFAVPHTDSPAEKQMYFATNAPVTEETAERLAESYRRRWGIETSYRMIGDFLAKTTSREFSIRLFYFLFAVMLYNLWVLTTTLMEVVIGEKLDRPAIPGCVFAGLLEARWTTEFPPPS